VHPGSWETRRVSATLAQLKILHFGNAARNSFTPASVTPVSARLRRVHYRPAVNGGLSGKIVNHFFRFRSSFASSCTIRFNAGMSVVDTAVRDSRSFLRARVRTAPMLFTGTFNSVLISS